MNKVKKFRNKYRITSPRIPWFDYGSNASYYITICTKDRKEFFGSIENREMLFSPIGRIVQDEWEKTPMIRPELNLIMDKYIIMPNHIHGIIVYNRAVRPVVGLFVFNRAVRPDGSIKYNRINKFGPQRNNIPSIIRGIKSSVTVRARKINLDFGWQSGYYVHIVRNTKDYERIVKYIKDNPKNYKGKK